MSNPLHILYVDDYALDRALVRDALEKEHGGFHVTEAASRQAFEARLGEDDYDLVLSDFNILGFEGLEVLDTVKTRHPEVPVVIVTGTGSEEVAAEALRRGASDYVIKSPEHIRRLPHTIYQAIEKQQLRDERREAQEALQQAYEEALRREEAVLNLAEDLKVEVAERKRTQAEMQELVFDLQFLSRSATELISLPVEDDIYAYIGENLSQLLDDAIVILNENDPTTGKMTIHGIYGLNTPLFERNTKVLGYSPVGKSYPMQRQAKRLFETGELETFDGGLVKLGDGYARGAVLRQVNRLLNINRVYLIGLAREGELYAGVQIYTRRDATIDRPDLIETFVHQASIALQRKRAERQLRTSEQRFRTLAQLAPVGIYITDRNGDCIYANECWLDMAGLSLEEALGNGWVKGLHSEDRDRIASSWSEAVRSSDHWSQEYRFQNREGDVTWIYGVASPQIDREGKIVGYIGVNLDVTQRKRAEETLRRTSEERRVLLELVPVGISITDEEGNIVDANRMSGELLGISVEEHKGRQDIIRPDGSPMPAAEYPSVRALKDGRIVHSVEMGIRRPDSDPMWISVSAAPIPLEGYGVAIAYADVTDRKRAEDALEKRAAQLALLNAVGGKIASELELRSLFESVPRYVQESFGYDNVAIFTLDRKNRALPLKGNQGMFSGHIPEDLILDLDEGIVGWAARHGETVLSNDIDADPRYITHYPEVAETRSELTVPIRPADQVLGVIDVQSKSLDAFDQEDVLTMETLADQIATAMENARLYKAEHAAREQLQDLAGYLQRAREEERTRIARALHDQFGQMMTALKMDVSTLSRGFSDDQIQLWEKADCMMETIDSGIEMLRRVCSELRPGVLDELGLAAAIEWQVDQFRQRSDIQVELNLHQSDGRAPSREVSTAVFRIFQEALTNVARHAEATRVRVELRFPADAVMLVIEDDGKGMTTSSADARGSLGLMGMQERARALDGEVTVESEPDRGTIVTARIPRDRHR
jgi:PAS domain S-box-containing protein